MAYADGSCTKEEQAILDLVAAETGVTAEARASLERLFVPAAERTSLLPVRARAIDDAATRAAHVKRETLKYAALTAVLGAFPIPGLAIATDLGVIALQVKMVRDIAQYWGHSLDREAAKSMLYGMGLGTGARLAVNNLAKLLPGWGSAVGATTSFASTYALGKVIDKFFAADAKGDLTALEGGLQGGREGRQGDVRRAQGGGRRAGRGGKEHARRADRGPNAGKITQAEMEQKLAEMAEK